MGKNYLLDTSELILSLQKDQAIRKRIGEANMLYASTIALGELYFGAEGTLHVARNMAEIMS
jgi:predicted nucleic acid-binding protein